MTAEETILRAGLAQLGVPTPTGRFPSCSPWPGGCWRSTGDEPDRYHRPAAVMRLHLLDSATLLTRPPAAGAAVCDVGCGPGFPGLPLAILRPDLRLTLVDSQRKRIDFVNRCIAELALENAAAVHARARSGPPITGRNMTDGVPGGGPAAGAQRAVPALTRVGGAFCAMKSVGSDEEIAASRRAIATLGGEIDRWTISPCPGRR